MDIRHALKKISEIIRHEGVGSAAQKIWRTIFPRGGTDDFDRANGTDTSGTGSLWRYTISSPNVACGVHYAATDPHMLANTISSLGIDPSAFTFVDLGCGKGRTLIIAKRMGFKRVVGVEFALELASICRGNLVKVGIADVEVVHGDAADYAFSSGPLVVFLYNPFGHTVLQRVVDRLRAIDHTVVVIYSNPVLGSMFDDAGFRRRDGGDLPVWILRGCSSAASVATVSSSDGT